MVIIQAELQTTNHCQQGKRLSVFVNPLLRMYCFWQWWLLLVEGKLMWWLIEILKLLFSYSKTSNTLSNPRSTTVSSSFTFKSEERAAKRKEASQSFMTLNPTKWSNYELSFIYSDAFLLWIIILTVLSEDWTEVEAKRIRQTTEY